MARGFGMPVGPAPMSVARDPQSAEESGYWPSNGPDDEGQADANAAWSDQPQPDGQAVASGGHADRQKKRKQAPPGIGEGIYRSKP